MRVSTNALVNNYNFNLNTIMVNKQNDMTTLLTHRKFQKGSEDPGAAHLSAKLGREYLQNQDYIETVKDNQSRLDMAVEAVMSIKKLADEGKESTLSAVNGTTSQKARETYAETLKQMQQAMLQSANSSYSGKYMFGGQESGTTPFTLDDAGNLLFRGVDVTTGEPAVLEAMSKETSYVDIGLGIATAKDASGNYNYNDSNALNTAIPGLSIFGFGTVAGSADPEISENIIALAGQMSEMLNCSDEEWEGGNYEKFSAMMDQYSDSVSGLTDSMANLGVQQSYLEATQNRLEDMDISYQAQLEDTEMVDDTEAITNLSYTEYAYNAALRVGNTILSVSLLDFLR